MGESVGLVGVLIFVFFGAAFNAVCAWIYSGRGSAAFIVSVIIAMISFIALMGCMANSIANPPQWCEYTVKTYYLDGGSKIEKVRSDITPYIYTDRGSYWLQGCEPQIIGVVRFDIISKKPIDSSEAPICY